ncbi:hypothetical protein CC86DRAFT_375759 [Ophiobolus disseminans]|uniref:F-box domain-containing protein n=1 Tax=Ophiobolus disseminans TaxID=1469910 RepID=A0A6A6ZCH3_9PLEO|nr:hypothetical protein CC86DRAFT_375759 [Ophiobolus disseminans]
MDTSGLPAEILSNIFTFVRTDEDMAAVSLVSRRWRDAMSRDMWAVTTSSLEPTMAKDFDALLSPQSGLLSHLTHLYVEDMEKSEDADERLRLLIAAIPKNKLREFDCNTDLPISTLRILLQRQQCMDRFDVLDVSELARKDNDDDWIEPSMASITDFAMTAPKKHLTDAEEKIQHYKTCRKIVNGLPRLKIFRVKDDDESHAEGNNVDIQHLFRGGDGVLRLPSLTEFALDGIYIRPSSPFILEHLELSTLKILYLYNCTGISEFLHGLSDSYSKQTGPLSSVTIDLGWHVADPAETKEAIQRFLSTCPKLTWLLMDFMKHTTVGIKCLEKHADTLEFLYLNMGSWPLCTMSYDVESLRALMQKCQKITTLCINIPESNLGPITDLADDFRLGPGRFDRAYVESASECFLDILASHPALKSLRLLNPPIIEFINSDRGIPSRNSEVEAKHCRVAMQNYADQVYRFMSARGSLIKLLVTQPASIPRVRPAKDKNSHQWPVYAYTKGSVTDARGVKTVVAVPLDKIGVEMTEQKSMTWN